MNNNQNIIYNPSLDEEVTKSVFSSLWSKETTDHILNISKVIRTGVTGGHTSSSLEEYYRDIDTFRDGEYVRPIAICNVEETDYPGYYIYNIKLSKINKGKVNRDNNDNMVFGDKIIGKHVIDLNQVSIEEFYSDAESALVGTKPLLETDGNYILSGTNKNGMTFKALLSKNNDGEWYIKTVFPVFKAKIIKEERTM